MLSGFQGFLDDFRLVRNREDDVDGLNVLSGEEVLEALSGTRIVRVDIN